MLWLPISHRTFSSSCRLMLGVFSPKRGVRVDHWDFPHIHYPGKKYTCLNKRKWKLYPLSHLVQILHMFCVIYLISITFFTTRFSPRHIHTYINVKYRSCSKYLCYVWAMIRSVYLYMHISILMDKIALSVERTSEVGDNCELKIN